MKLCNALYTRKSERFLRLTQKIPISLSGGKVEHCDATILEMKPALRVQGTIPRLQVYDGQVDSSETLSGVQSVNGATQRLRVHVRE